VIAPILVDQSLSVGQRILHATQATLAQTHCNTNLGIILLAAPLAQAALISTPDSFRSRVKLVLSNFSMDDTQAVFEAIASASPGGLGEHSDHDVRRPASISLIEAMSLAAPKDYIARQYTTGFADILGFGLRRLCQAKAKWPDCAWAPALWCYLGFLSRKPDSHIIRKYGLDKIDPVMKVAKSLERAMCKTTQPQGLLPKFLAADELFKSQNINPGTSADMTVGSLLVSRLMDIMPPRKV
jgi:triphosphoribosyl-dephospho-CoA synthase